MALVDASYKFIFVDIGCNGRVSDGGVFKNCNLYKALEESRLNIPKPVVLPNSTHTVPYVIVADDAFAMTNYMIKPFSQAHLTKEKRIFNYRLSRARRVVENAFGILANRFRIFINPIALSPEKVEVITVTSCIIHNYLRSKSTEVYSQPTIMDHENLLTHEVMPGEWRKDGLGAGFRPFTHQGSKNSAKEIRNTFCDYFNSSTGAVDWQEKMI